jgi:hypothetical protein
MQLHAGESRGAHGLFDLIQRRIDKDADLLYRMRQVGYDGGDLRCRHAARAGRKHEADGIGASIDR